MESTSESLGFEELNDDELYFNPNSIERVCCIELENNNKILIPYMESWTIKDLIKIIIETKEFKNLYPQRNKILNSPYHLHLFDLHLCLFDDFKLDYENKISFNIKIDDLHSLGLIKNYKFPFFTFKQNKLPLSFIYNSLHFNDLIKEVKDNNNNYFHFYTIYLPRNNCLNKLNANPELEELFTKNKKGYNEFSKFKSNSLTVEKNLDWFIYDNESMKFLLKMNKMNIKVGTSLEEINGHLYYEDKMEKIKENSQLIKKKEELNKFLVNLTCNLFQNKVSKKMVITTETTSLDLIKTIAVNITALNKGIEFIPEEKILKVRGLNDYIFDINEPLINFSYINECISQSKNAEYLIIDNPKIKQQNSSKMSATIYEEEKYNFEELLKVAKYNEQLDNLNNGECNNKEILSKSYKNIEELKNENDSLDNFINSMIDDLYNNDINTLNVENNDDNKEDISYYNIKKIEFDNSSIKKSTFLSLNNRKKGLKRNKQTNIYINSKPLDLNKIYSEFDRNIFIKDINKPFTILVKNIFFSSIDYNIYNNLIILFKFGIYCGNQLYGKITQLKWKYESVNLNPLLNKRIYFDINYNTLPTFSSIIFKVKYIEYIKTNEIKSSMTKYWGNFRLFDHNKKLRTGQHKIHLLNRLFGEDSYYSYIDNFKDNKCPKIYFEIESFSNPIINEVKYVSEGLPNNYNIDSKDLEKVTMILNKNPFDSLSNYEKEILWNNRYFAAKMSSLVPKLLLCFNFNDPKYLIELEKIFSLSEKEITVIKSIELLSGLYLHEKIRKFAVKCLRRASIKEIKNHLLQLFQGLKYEMNHDNELAIFLIEKAVNYPISIGHSFFWFLKAEICNQDFQQRFGIYLEIFLNKIGKQFSTIFSDEDHLLKDLISAAKIFHYKHLTKENQLKSFKIILENINKKLKENNKSISLPLDFKYRIRQLKIEKCKVMKSKKKPLWLVFGNSDPYGDDIIVMFKKGDDLRMDMVTLQIFKEMQNLWYNNNLFLKMSLYKVICTGNNEGMLEMVTNSETLANIHKQEGKINF